LGDGVEIRNNAEIVFDVNPPIITADWVNRIDKGAPSSQVSPLPATSSTTFTVNWSGSDAGSGITFYDVYTSRDNGAWEPWQIGTSNTSATFVAPEPGTYRFYSVARDGVGSTTVGGGGRTLYLPIIRR
jgi:hypothetical protein